MLLQRYVTITIDSSHNHKAIITESFPFSSLKSVAFSRGFSVFGRHLCSTGKVSIGKVSIGKISIGKISIGKDNVREEEEEEEEDLSYLHS